MTPVLNPQTERDLQSLRGDLPQSVLLSGEVGVGLGTIARFIATSLQAVPMVILPEKNDKIDLEKGSIAVETIRDLYEQTRTKRATKHIIIIDYAERMSKQAQNAFLKLLEEPNDSTYFILATHTPGQLLPTVRSRMRLVEIRSITQAQSEKFLDTLQVHDTTTRSQILFMAAGLPAEMKRLVDDSDHFTARVAIMRDARNLLQDETYNKLLIAHLYKDRRDDALQLLQDAAKIIRRTMSAKPSLQLRRQIDRLLTTYDHIAANGNIRLCLAQLVLQ